MKMPDFKYTIPVQKSDRQDGWFILGYAAGAETDIEGQRIAPEAITGFAQQINESPIPFKDWHAKNTVLAEIGEVEKAWVEPDFRMGVEVKLDEDHPTAQLIWKKLEKGKQYGMSVSGQAKKWKNEFDGAIGKSVLTLYDIALEEVSITTKPVWTPSFGTVLRKAIDEAAEAESVEKGEKASMDETPQVGVAEATETVTPQETATTQPADSGETATAETTVSENPQPAETTNTTEATEASTTSAPETVETHSEATVEKAVNAETKREANKLNKLVKLHQEMATLISDLGLGTEASETDSTGEPEQAVVTKAVEETSSSESDLLVLVKALSDEMTGLRKQVDDLRAFVPEVNVPAPIVQKGQDESVMDELAKMSPEDRLRFALAAMKRA